MSGVGRRKSVAATEAENELKQLQLELRALKRIRQSLYAVEHMVGCLNQNIQMAIKNGDTLADLNQGWKIFFTGKK